MDKDCKGMQSYIKAVFLYSLFLSVLIMNAAQLKNKYSNKRRKLSFRITYIYIMLAFIRTKPSISYWDKDKEDAREVRGNEQANYEKYLLE